MVKAAFPFLIGREYKHSGNKTMSKEEAKFTITMGITMKVNSLYLKKTDKDSINGKTKQGMRDSFGAIILLVSVGLSISIMNFMKGKFLMEKERVSGSIVILMETSSEVSGRTMRS